MTIRTKKLFTIFFSFLFISILSAKSAFARSGCCSHHGGVCGCGCCDGTGLSTTCAPYYPECGGNNPIVVKQIITPKATNTPRPRATSIPKSTSTPKPTKTPTVKPTKRPTKKPTPTKKPNPTATMTPTNTPTPTLIPTLTSTITATSTPTEIEITPTVNSTITITPKTNNPAQPKTTFWQNFFRLFNRK